MAEVEARIPNRRDEMPTIAAMVEQFGLTHLVPSRVVNEFNVALDEVLNNIISYGFEPGEQSEILVRLSLRQGEIVAEIEDAGRPFDPLSAQPPDLTGGLRERRVGGLGIHFVRNLMDAVEYARVGERNRLRLSKTLPPG
jgi:serine/threonine-protein kinase RsbW